MSANCRGLHRKQFLRHLKWLVIYSQFSNFSVRSSVVKKIDRGHKTESTVQSYEQPKMVKLHEEEEDEAAPRASVLDRIKEVKLEMRKRSSDPVCQALGCRELESIADEHDGNKEKIAKLGGIVAIICAMSDHKEDSHVQASACHALATLASSDLN